MSYVQPSDLVPGILGIVKPTASQLAYHVASTLEDAINRLLCLYHIPPADEEAADMLRTYANFPTHNNTHKEILYLLADAAEGKWRKP